MRTDAGEILAGRAGYLAASVAVFFSQHLVLLALLTATHGNPAALPWWFWLNPFRGLVGPALMDSDLKGFMFTAAMVATLAVDVALVALALRRVRRLGNGGWAAALAIVPIVQLGAVAWLAVAPRRSSDPEATLRSQTELDARTAVTSVLAGVGLIVATVALSTLVFGLYGYALFLVSPGLIALIVGYLVNRRGRVGPRRTFEVILFAFLLGAAALMGFAFEGVVCLAMASPIIALAGLIGGGLGIALADMGRQGRGATLTSVALIPLLVAGEAVLPPRAAFDSAESVEVAAPPAAVWAAVVRMAPIAEPPAAPFRWGLAYPVSGQVLGSGVGAVRRSVFSTGAAYERVTRWEPQARLSFTVLSQPPAMRELSPYARVNAPHDSGYFRTTDADVTLAPLPGGRTRLTFASHHELDLEPALYWTPLAQWAVRVNTRRVLAHLRAQAEAAAKG